MVILLNDVSIFKVSKSNKKIQDLNLIVCLRY